MARLNQQSGSPTQGRRTGETRQSYAGPTFAFVMEKAKMVAAHKAIAGKTHFVIAIDKLDNGQWRVLV